MKPGRSYQKDLIEDLKNGEEAAAYLTAALEAGHKGAFLLALRNVIEAQGGMAKFAKKVKVHRVSLYKMLSRHGNPEFESILSLLAAIGVRFQLVSKFKSKSQTKAA